jgi:hypothetical protein
MNVSDFVATCHAGLDIHILPGHVRVIQHFMNSHQPLWTFQVCKTGRMLQVSAIFNNSSSSRHARLLSCFNPRLAVVYHK